MGTANSRIEEDKALQICRERKKIVRQALDGRCSLAATHVAYIEALKMAGRALRNFVESEAPIDSSIYTPSERSLSHFSFSSVPKSQHVDVFPSPSPPTSARYNANHMKFRSTFSKEVEEKPDVSVTESVTSFTPHNSLLLDTPPPSYEPPSAAYETPPWDFFGLGHTSHGTLGGQNKTEDDRGSLSEDEQHNNGLSPETESSHESNDGFDDPSSETLVRRFVNVNRSEEAPADESVTLEAKAMIEEKGDSHADESVMLEAKAMLGEKGELP